METKEQETWESRFKKFVELALKVENYPFPLIMRTSEELKQFIADEIDKAREEGFSRRFLEDDNGYIKHIYHQALQDCIEVGEKMKLDDYIWIDENGKVHNDRAEQYNRGISDYQKAINKIKEMK